MTRIISGEWRGHPLPNLKTGSVRPTTDRARTVLFDTLWDVRNFHVLDLFSGTGALGFEALSRGAESLVSIDRDPKYIDAQTLWMKNRKKEFKAYKNDVSQALRLMVQKFDLILADPPYDEGLDTNIIRQIESLIQPSGLFVFEKSKRDETLIESEIFDLYKEKIVAETRFQIYKAGAL